LKDENEENIDIQSIRQKVIEQMLRRLDAFDHILETYDQENEDL
jgi:molecular chaperone GrpE (heat shock protein)